MIGSAFSIYTVYHLRIDTDRRSAIIQRNTKKFIDSFILFVNSANSTIIFDANDSNTAVGICKGNE